MCEEHENAQTRQFHQVRLSGLKNCKISQQSEIQKDRHFKETAKHKGIHRR